MTRISVLAAVLAAAGLTACAQTPAGSPPENAAEQSSPPSSEAAAKSQPEGQAGFTGIVDNRVDAGHDNMKNTSSDADNNSGDYWLKYGLAGLLDSRGKRHSALRIAGPYKIFETKGKLVRISADQDHWVRRIDLSSQPPARTPTLNTGPPERPVTRFPNALEEEAKRRGIDLKAPPSD